MFSNVIRWFYRTFLKQDYVSFKITSTCTVIIKSYFLLTPLQTAKIRALIKEIGYIRRNQQQKLIITMGLYLLQKKALPSSKTIITSQYSFDFKKRSGRLLINIRNDA